MQIRAEWHLRGTYMYACALESSSEQSSRAGTEIFDPCSHEAVTTCLYNSVKTTFSVGLAKISAIQNYADGGGGTNSVHSTFYVTSDIPGIIDIWYQ